MTNDVDITFNEDVLIRISNIIDDNFKTETEENQRRKTVSFRHDLILLQ